MVIGCMSSLETCFAYLWLHSQSANASAEKIKFFSACWECMNPLFLAHFWSFLCLIVLFQKSFYFTWHRYWWNSALVDNHNISPSIFVQAHTWLTRQTTLFTSTWTRKLFYCLNLVDHHPEIKYPVRCHWVAVPYLYVIYQDVVSSWKGLSYKLPCISVLGLACIRAPWSASSICEHSCIYLLFCSLFRFFRLIIINQVFSSTVALTLWTTPAQP